MDVGTAAPPATAHRHSGTAMRTLVIGVTAFLTVVDLFATQAILPSLARAYAVSPAAMGFAVNASTMGMAFAGLAVALFSRRINRRLGILVSLALLSIPTALPQWRPTRGVHPLRIIQGTLHGRRRYADPRLSRRGMQHGGRREWFAAYITGNVASNLVGRLMAAALVDHLGLSGNFMVFAGLNLAGALLVYVTIGRTPSMAMSEPVARSALAIWGEHLRNKKLLASFAIGFCILFAFIGTFTYVNFVLVKEPFASA